MTEKFFKKTNERWKVFEHEKSLTRIDAVKDWLHKRAVEEFFSFDEADFQQDCNELLKDYNRADDAVEDEIRKELWCQLRTWQLDKEYLSSLNLHRVVAKHLRIACRQARCDETLESWKELRDAGCDETQESRKELRVFDGLADEIAFTIRAALDLTAPSVKDIEPKFSEELSLDGLDKFHLGLENLIGYPATNANFLDLMKREHERGEMFVDRKDRCVDPRVEWNIVMRCEKRNIDGVGYEPSPIIEKRVCLMPLGFYFKRSKKEFEKAAARGLKAQGLDEAEVAALRLWTGPMHKKYAELLRNPQNKDPNGYGLCPYVNTLHAINSGITKLARIWRLPTNRKVYRGYRGLTMKHIQKDVFYCAGGVEKSVLATSEEFDCAVDYSDDGAFILEIDVGQVNRGADVSWLSQFPHEREVLFNALSNVEFLRSPQRRFVKGKGTILVYQVALSANLKSKTLEEIFRVRKDLHLNLVEVLMQEALGMIQQREEGHIQSLIQDRCDKCREKCKGIHNFCRDCTKKCKQAAEGFIKVLGDECRKKCQRIRYKAVRADIDIFNKGTPAYLSLVDAAHRFKMRSLEIIDLALGWIRTPQNVNPKADPAKLDGLKNWQLRALRTAFQSSPRPLVQIMVLEHQDRHLESIFEAECLKVGDVHKPETALSVARLLSLNPNLVSLNIEVSSPAAKLWEQVFCELCKHCREGGKLAVNDFRIAQYGLTTLQQLELRNTNAQIAAMIAPALLFHGPIFLASLSLYGSPIACEGAESLGRAFTGLQRLRYVDLRQCSIADRGCTWISENLSSLTELVSLNLAHNNVKDSGFKVIASAVTGLMRLTTVDMRFNSIRSPSIRFPAERVIQSNVVSKLSQNARVVSVVWSPDGGRIASGSCDKTIIIWDVKTDNLVSTFKGHTECVNSVAWSPKGDQIVSGCGNPYNEEGGQNEIIIWNIENADKFWKLGGHNAAVMSVSWSPDGDKIASGSHDRTIIIWDLRARTKYNTLKGHTSFIRTVAWSLQGTHLASGSDDKSIIIWDAVTGHKLLTLDGHSSGVLSVGWSPDGTRIASGSDDNSIIIWDAKTKSQVQKLVGHSECVNSVAWSPKGDQIVSGCGNPYSNAGGQNEIIVWDVKTGLRVSMHEGHNAAVMSVSWCPHCPDDGKIASGSHDQTIIIWDVKTDNQVSTFEGHTECVNSMAWSPAGDQIVFGCGNPFYDEGGQNEIIVWNVKTSLRVFSLKGGVKDHSAAVMSVSWSPDGDKIASGSRDKTIIIWDAKKGGQILTLNGHTECVNCVSWSQQGKLLASGSDDKSIIIWDVETGEKVQLEGQTCAVRSALKKAKSESFKTVMNESTIIIGHAAQVQCVAWSPDGMYIASGSKDQTVIIWNAQQNKYKAEKLLKGHLGAIFSLAWCKTPDRRQVVTGSADKTVIVWDCSQASSSTWQQVRTLNGHTNTVQSVAWSPSGNHIASASADMTVVIWDANTGAIVSQLTGHSDILNCVTWSVCGDKIISCSRDKTVVEWDLKIGELGFKGHSGVSTDLSCDLNGHVKPESTHVTVMGGDDESGDRTVTLLRHSGRVQGVAWSQAGDKMVVAFSDQSFVVWDAETGRQMST